MSVRGGVRTVHVCANANDCPFPLSITIRTHSNSNLIAGGVMSTEDATAVVDRPHVAAAGDSSHAMLSVTLTVAVLGACVLLGMLVWRKYAQ